MTYYLAIYGGALLTVIAQLILKKGAKGNILNLHYILGNSIFVVIIFLTLYALKEVKLVELVAIYPLTYIGVIFFSYLLFNEKMNKKQILSVLLIILGVVIFNLS